MDPVYIGADAPAAVATADQIGSKAANLLRLARIGLRVPPAFVLDTRVCRETLHNADRPPGLTRPALRRAVEWLERTTRREFGGSPPLLVSVRSSPPISMPGMLETVLNVGLTEAATRGLLKATGNPSFVWDTSRRFAHAFAETVAGVPRAMLAGAEQRGRVEGAGQSFDAIDPLTLRELARQATQVARAAPRVPLPDDPYLQLEAAIEAVFRSWLGPRARDYRRLMGGDEETGTAVVVQAMVFGNARSPSGSGVGFTRNPSTGADELYVDFAFDAQGEDVVSGRERVDDSARLGATLPAVARELADAKVALEREFRDMQDFEFTVESGELYFLQSRAGKRTPWAALHIAVDLVAEQIIAPDEALRRLERYSLDDLSRERLQVDPGCHAVATAVAAGIGVATGAIALDSERARALAAAGPVILVRADLSTEDLAGLAVARGILTAHGGRTSHAAVVARQMGKVCLAGCSTLLVDEARRRCSMGGATFVEGDVITLDGDAGVVYAGVVPTVAERPARALALVRQWQALASSRDDGRL